MKINFGLLAFVILAILAITMGFGYLLTRTGFSNPSTQRVHAAIMLREADHNLACTATVEAYRRQPAEATVAAIQATTTAIAISSSQQTQAAMVTVVAIDYRKRYDALALQERAARLKRQSDNEDIVILCAVALVAVVCTSLFIYLVGTLVSHSGTRTVPETKHTSPMKPRR